MNVWLMPMVANHFVVTNPAKTTNRESNKAAIPGLITSSPQGISILKPCIIHSFYCPQNYMTLSSQDAKKEVG